MTPLPKRRLSKARQGKRRHAIKLALTGITSCPNCHQPSLPHTVCKNCGMYEGKQILTIGK